MKQIKPKGEWLRSSATPNRSERLRAHEEFEASELKKMLDNNWKVKSARVKRPRIKKQPSKMPFTIWFGITADIPMEILIKAGFAK